MQITRKIFLKAGGSGLAILGTGPLWAQDTQAAPKAATRTSADPVILRSRALEMVLDRKRGLPRQYPLRAGAIRFRGEDQGVPVNAVICATVPLGIPQRRARPALRESYSRQLTDGEAAKYQACTTLAGPDGWRPCGH